MTLRPIWTFFKLYVFKQGFRDGVEGFMFCALSGVSVAVQGVEASRVDSRGEGIMIAEHEAVVAARFDALCARFKRVLAPDDARLRAIVESLSPLAGRRVLDLGCGKGRFARSLAERGADVVGLDFSSGMLAEATGIARVRAVGAAAAVWPRRALTVRSPSRCSSTWRPNRSITFAPRYCGCSSPEERS